MKKLTSILLLTLLTNTFALADDSYKWDISDDGILTVSGREIIGERTILDIDPEYIYYTFPWSDKEISEKITTVNVSDGAEILGDFIFHATGAESIYLPESVKEIKSNAFSGCNNLKNITLPSQIEAISENCFRADLSLKTITVPQNVKEIQSYAFRGCTALESITLSDNIEKLGDGIFYDCTSLKSIKLPEKITEIPSSAFLFSENMQFVLFPKNLKKINQDAFTGCKSLEEIYLPDGLEVIENSAFSSCVNLKKAYVPKSVNFMGDYAFGSENNLTIYGYKDSYAEKYAKERKIKFEYVTSSLYDEYMKQEHEVKEASKKVLKAEKTSDGIKLYANDKEILLGDKKMLEKDSFIAVPLNTTAKALGFDTVFNDTNQTLTLTNGTNTIIVSSGSFSLNKDNVVTRMKKSAELYQGEIYVSLEDAADILLFNLAEFTDDTIAVFIDVPPDHWAYDDIMTLAKNNVILGYGNNYFGVNDSVTNEQLAILLKRQFNYDEKNTSASAAKRENIIVSLIKALNPDLSKVDTSVIAADFSDGNKISDSDKPYIAYAVENKIVLGDNGNLNLENNVTRAETAALINRALKIKK